MQEKVFKIIQWILFIVLISASGWFASGVLQHFFSHKTSFSQHQEKVNSYPIVNIILGCLASEVNPSDVEIKYRASEMANFTYLEIGENHLPNDK